MTGTTKTNAVRVADFIADHLHTMAKWGAAIEVVHLTDRRVMVNFQDKTPSVVITVSEPKAKSP